MKKSTKAVLSVGMILPAMSLLTACDFESQKYVTSIYQSASSESTTTYTIVYSDGSTSNFSVNNGKNGSDLTLENIYDSAVENGYNGDYWSFVQEYLSISIDNDNLTMATNKAMLSAVSIYSAFPVTSVVPNITINSFGVPVQNGTKEQKSTAVSAGSGVIYRLDKTTGDAYIITNYHVVYDVDSDTENNIGNTIKVYLYGSEDDVYYKTDSNGNYIYDSDGYPVVEYGDNSITCEYVGGSMNYDIAVLKVSGNELMKNSDARAVEVADSYYVGEDAVAIGNPEAEGISVTKGVVSVDSEYISMTGVDDETTVTFRVMRIDTAINSGNSGGGLFDVDGKLIGIVNAKTSDTTIENMGYAIPYSTAIGVADSIIEGFESSSTNTLSRFIMGMSLSSKNSKGVLNLNTGATDIKEDVCISAITVDSLASTLGVQVDDIIKSIVIGDTTYDITRLYQLIDASLTIRVGDEIELYVERDGNQHIFTYTAESKYFTIIK